MSLADKAKEFAGNVQEKIGEMTGNKDAQHDGQKTATEGQAGQVAEDAQGMAEQAKGKVEGAVEGIKDKFSNGN